MKKLAVAIISSVLLASATFWFLMLRTHASIDTTEVDRPFSISAHAPPLIWGSGAAFAIISGELNGTAKIEIVGNRERDRSEILVGPGKVDIARGGAEDWIPDYHIRYTPITVTNGRLYVAVYCGDGMNEQDRKLHHEISRRN